VVWPTRMPNDGKGRHRSRPNVSAFATTLEPEDRRGRHSTRVTRQSFVEVKVGVDRITTVSDSRRATTEEWAASVVQKSTGALVSVHDDGSRPSMYDLRVGPAEAPSRAIEVTGAVDPVVLATWNTGPARGQFPMHLRGDWLIQIEPGTFVRRVAAQLERLLQLVEAYEDGTVSVPVDHVLRAHNPDLYGEFEAIGVAYFSRIRVRGSGKVSFTMPGRGGCVDDRGDELPGWLATWLREPDRADNLLKLAAAAAVEREVFIAVTLDGAPWSVVSYLTGEMTRAPTAAPSLPDPLTGVWVCPTHGRKGVYWDGLDWSLIETRVA